MGARRGRACGVMGWALCAELFIPTGVGLQGEKVGEVGSRYQAWRTDTTSNIIRGTGSPGVRVREVSL